MPGFLRWCELDFATIHGMTQGPHLPGGHACRQGVGPDVSSGCQELEQSQELQSVLVRKLELCREARREWP